MKDINDVEIKAGDLIKKMGTVVYAEGPKEKVSKKTWTVVDSDGLKLTRDGEISEFSGEERYLIVGNIETGIKQEYLPVIGIANGSVPVKYRLLKDYPEKNWFKNEILMVIGKVSSETLENGILEKVPDDTPHTHVLVVVDPVSVGLSANDTQ